MTLIRMADSAQPQDVPRLFAQRPNGVAAYNDGDYAWPAALLATFPRCWRITVIGDPALAVEARVIDVEHGDAGPQDVEPYRAARAARRDQTNVYCDRSTFPLVVEACPHWELLLWWIATLDDNPAWNPATMRAWLLANYGTAPAENMIRAIQIYGRGTYDESRIFGDPQWEASV